MRTVYGNQERFETTYFKKFNGFYCTGDGMYAYMYIDSFASNPHNFHFSEIDFITRIVRYDQSDVDKLAITLK